jgi:hypothetical protein
MVVDTTDGVFIFNARDRKWDRRDLPDNVLSQLHIGVPGSVDDETSLSVSLLSNDAPVNCAVMSAHIFKLTRRGAREKQA